MPWQNTAYIPIYHKEHCVFTPINITINKACADHSGSHLHLVIKKNGNPRKSQKKTIHWSGSHDTAGTW